MRLFTFALLLLALLAGSAFADGYSYDARSGHYFDSAGNAYTRICTWQPGYWYYGRYVQGYYLCSYYPAQPKVAAAAKLSYLDPDWRKKMLELKAQMIEQDAFVASAKALGLTVADDPVTAAYSRFAPQGSTIWGTSIHSLQQSWGVDPRVEGLAQSYRLAEQSIAAGKEGREGHQAVVREMGADFERRMAMATKIAGSIEILKAIEGTGTRTESKLYQWKTMPKADGGVQVERDDSQVPHTVRANVSAQWLAAAKQDCGGCHEGDKPKGNFRVSDYQKLDMKAKVAVWERLATPDDSKRMPRTEDGSAGPRMAPERLALWLLN